MSGEIQRFSNFIGETQTSIHDQEISAIIDQLNRNSDSLDNQTTNTSVVYSQSISITSGSYSSSGSSFLTEQAFGYFTHNLGYYPVVEGYISVSGTLYGLPYIQVDPSTGSAILEAYLYPTDNTNSTSRGEVAVYTHGTTPALTFYVYCFSVPSGITQIGS